MQEYDSLEDSRKAFDSYIPSGIKSRWYDLTAGNADEGGIANIFSNNKIFGRTTQLHDEMGDFLRFTAAMYSPGVTRQRQRDLLNKAIAVSEDKIKEWKNVIDMNVKDMESYDKVSPYFERRAKNAGTDIFSLDTWTYGMPGLIAGSTSGASKILPAMLLGLATGGAATAAAGVYGTAAALGVGAAGALGTYGLNYGAGIAENNAEVAEAYNEQVEDYLKNNKGFDGKTLYQDLIREGKYKLGDYKMSDEQVFEEFKRGRFKSDNAKLNKKLSQLAVGIESQFQDDMMATTYGAGFETVLEVLPFGKLLDVPRALRYKMLTNSRGRKFLRTGVGKTLEKGY